ncbi:hypothetical protein COMNV_00730 [Commensalibacter sp. Nvir]|uniref:energy transducer TonB n=1 Tax=Commensalibacter sp. Nvir TaxID=3069817 RepID=UPI002D26017F|nr:hypothetical protein COMNV_00730 [Commensalibacter sp. Nvir]
MFSYNERHPIEHIIGFLGVLILHILLIGGSIMLIHSPQKERVDTPPLQVQVVEVSSSTSTAVEALQPPPPEMIMPPPPEVNPPPINTEAPVQPKKPPVVKQVQKQVPQPRQSEDQTNKPVGDQGASVRPPGVGTPDQSAGSKPLNGARIVYPPDMEEAGKEGRVILSCDVETNGSTNNCKIISAIGGNSFKEAALEYVHRARYSPATLNGKPVKELAHRYTITFRLGAND